MSVLVIKMLNGPIDLPISAEHRCRSFWHGYNFVCGEEEEAYRERCYTADVRIVRVSVLLILFLDLAIFAMFFADTFRLGMPHWYYYMYIPAIAVCAATLLVLTRLPGKYLYTFLSAFAVLVVAAHGLIVSTGSSATVSMARSHLPSVYSEISENAVALQELQEYIILVNSSQGTSTGLAFCGIVMVMLLVVGVHRTTIVATALIPVAFGCALLGGSVAIVPAAFRVALLALSCMFLLLAMRLGTLTRRRQFRLERMFHAALQAAVQGARKADSVLHHTLKNTMADAAGELDALAITADLPEAPSRHLQLSLASLRRGMRSCRHRQVYLHLESKSYRPSLQPVNLHALVEDVTAGRAMEVTVDPRVVLMDEDLCSLILDNSIDNAFKHGHPRTPQVQLSVTATTAAHTQGADCECVRLTFRLSNNANPARPRMTDDFITAVLEGRSKENAGAMSDQMGLRYCLLAAEALGMQTSLTQADPTVVFEAVVDVQVAPAVASGGSSCSSERDQGAGAFPSGLKICYIDDSESARRHLDFGLRTWADTHDVHVYGAAKEDVGQFTAAVLDGANIAIFDEHLEFPGEELMYGSDIVREVFRRGFRGLACTRSGNVGPEDEAKYRAAGVHCVFGKDLPMQTMIAQMKGAYVRKFLRAPATFTDGPSPSTSVESPTESPAYDIGSRGHSGGSAGPRFSFVAPSPPPEGPSSGSAWPCGAVSLTGGLNLPNVPNPDFSPF